MNNLTPHTRDQRIADGAASADMIGALKRWCPPESIAVGKAE